MLKPNQYSTIRGEPKHRPADGYNLTAFYDAILKWPVLFSLIAGYLVLFQKDTLPNHIDGALKNNHNDILYLALLGFSIIGGIRVFQSLFLARRDYQHLESNIWDIFIFFCVLIFTSGCLFYFFQLKPQVILTIYIVLVLIGVVNFFSLWRFRIPKNDELYDYPIEMRIQLINILTFLLVEFILFYAALNANQVSASNDLSYSWIAVITTYLPLLFNIVHSHELTLIPKFFLKNDPDSPEQQVIIFKKIFWRTSDRLSDSHIKEIIHKDASESFKLLRTVRAKENDIDKIAMQILVNFDYIFEYIFATKDRSKIKNALVELLTVSYGLGSYGYMYFYVIKQEDKMIGFIKLDTSHNSAIYRFSEIFILPFKLAKVFGFYKLFGIYQRAKEVAYHQPKPEHGEVRITYFVILPEYQKLGYGSSSLNLLIGALIRNVTNDIVAKKLTLFVRESNREAKKLFEKIGFKSKQITDLIKKDPFSDIEKIGSCISMEYAS